MSSRPPGVSICAWGWRMELLADCDEMHGVLERYVLPWLPRKAAGDEPADAVFEVLRQAGGFELRSDGCVIASSTTADGIVPALQMSLDEAIVRCIPDLSPVHAGAVARGGAAVLLPGPSHAGKSTLVGELLRRGFTYYSDEYALLDRSGRLHAYPRALMLRNGNGDTRPALPSDWGAEVGQRPVEVALVAAVEHAPGAAWRVMPVPKSEMLLTLLKNTPRVLREAPGILDPFSAAVAAAACYSGVRGEAAEAAAGIVDLLEARA
jgi:hypothetical protein